MRRSVALFVRFLALVLVSAPVLAACTQPPRTAAEARARMTPLEREAAKLQTARETWARQKPAAYTYTLRRRCFDCPPQTTQPVTITVRGGQATATLPGGAAAPADPFARYGTVESLFAMADTAIAAKPYRVVGTYDATLGYPISLQVDERRTKASQPEDDQTAFFVSDFRRLP